MYGSVLHRELGSESIAAESEVVNEPSSRTTSSDVAPVVVFLERVRYPPVDFGRRLNKLYIEEYTRPTSCVRIDSSFFASHREVSAEDNLKLSRAHRPRTSDSNSAVMVRVGDRRLPHR